MAVPFHNGNVTRHNSFGTTLHKLEYFLLGGRVHIVKEYAPNPSSLATVLDIEVVIAPRSSSRWLLIWSTIFKEMNRTPNSYMAQDGTSEILMRSPFLQCWVPHCFTDCWEPGWYTTIWKALMRSCTVKALIKWSLQSYVSPHNHWTCNTNTTWQMLPCGLIQSISSTYAEEGHLVSNLYPKSSF